MCVYIGLMPCSVICTKLFLQSFLFGALYKSVKRDKLKLNIRDNKYKTCQILMKYSFYNTTNSPEKTIKTHDAIGY